MNKYNQAPFPYFGGKSSIANKVWELLGSPKHYIEPFFGSGAVLLNRPDYDHTKHVETINDADGYMCNVWRALKADPEKVAYYCDWPVDHADLHARRKKLIEQGDDLLNNLINDDEYYNAKLAAYWIWGMSCWIGAGLITPCKTNNICPIPHISDGGCGANKLSMRDDNIYKWFNELANRLRHVRVVCGDWKCVCGGNWQTKMGACGMFFDPPYGVNAQRSKNTYYKDSETVADDVAHWALDKGNNEKMRIVLAGYYEEHEWLLKHGWRVHRWNTNGGYGGSSNTNRHREALFISPYCINTELNL